MEQTTYCEHCGRWGLCQVVNRRQGRRYITVLLCRGCKIAAFPKLPEMAGSNLRPGGETMNDDAILEYRRHIAATLHKRGLTLNRKPAYVCGLRNQFATVRQTTGILEGDWAWSTLTEMVRRGSHSLSL